MSEEQDIAAREERAREHAGAQVQLAALYRIMCQSAAFQDLDRELKAKMADLKNKWLTADDAEGQRIKIRAQVYNEIFDLIKSKILQGDMASRTIDKLNEEKQHPYQI